MREKDEALARQWQLPFREDQIWDAMPESTRKDCRALLEELLKETLNRPDGRESNERQD